MADKRGKGTINKSEFIQLMRDVKIIQTEQEVSDMEKEYRNMTGDCI